MVSVPVAVKLLPFYFTPPNLVSRLSEAGEKKIVLFGREPIWQISHGDLYPLCIGSSTVRACCKQPHLD